MREFGFRGKAEYLPVNGYEPGANIADHKNRFRAAKWKAGVIVVSVLFFVRAS